MTIKEYQDYVKEGMSPKYTKQLAIVGTMGELGELADVIKKEAIYADMSKFIAKYGMPVDAMLESELGDVLWQVFCLANVCGLDVEKVLEHNVAKLNARHGGAGKIDSTGGVR